MTTHTHPIETRSASGCRGCGGHSSPRKHGGCGCGCDSTEMCGLECLERPAFSAGMVLSDSDLTALVEWTSGRLGLQRLRHGWGVVCGLDVRCDKDAPGRVVVEPGYAVGCCGEDIVLCEPQKVDLTGCCKVEAPCGEPSPAEDKELVEVSYDAPDRSTDCGDVVVDIVLEPTQTPSATGLVPGCGCGSGGGCRSGGGCGSAGRTGDTCGDQHVVSTRTRDGGRAYAVKVSFPGGDAQQVAAERAHKEYVACHDVVAKYVDQGRKEDATRDDIVGWLRRQDIDPPCDWWTSLCAEIERADGPYMVEAAVARALLDLVADCRHRLLRAGCAGCYDDDAVGLARVWLRRTKVESGESCVVTRVDAYPPFRHELAVVARPVPAGAEDLAPFVWQRWDQVCARWRRLAPGTPAEIVEFSDTRGLLDLLEQTARLWWACDEWAPTPVLVDTPCLGIRVLGFRPASKDEGVFRATDSMSSTAPASSSPPDPPSPADEAAAGAGSTEVVEDNGARLPAWRRLRLGDAIDDGPARPAGLPEVETEVQPDVLRVAQPVAPDLESLRGVGEATLACLRAGNIATVDELLAVDKKELAELLRSAPRAQALREEAIRAVKEGR